MSTTTPDLVDRLATPEATGLDPVLLAPLLRLLANGEPVDVPERATGPTLDRRTPPSQRRSGQRVSGQMSGAKRTQGVDR